MVVLPAVHILRRQNKREYSLVYSRYVSYIHIFHVGVCEAQCKTGSIFTAPQDVTKDDGFAPSKHSEMD